MWELVHLIYDKIKSVESAKKIHFYSSSAEKFLTILNSSEGVPKFFGRDKNILKLGDNLKFVIE